MPAVNWNDHKPMMTSSDLIRMMKEEKGILFNRMNERKAEEYLRERNNYFRTASYRKNYPKYQQGPNKGKYIRLEFSYLCEMATLDAYLRNILLQMCLDVEHSLKVQLLSDIEDDDHEDGYTLVNDFLKEYPEIKKTIRFTSKASFTNGIIEKYSYTFMDESKKKDEIPREKECPVWAFLELLTFGQFLRFQKFCYSNTGAKEKIPSKGIINPIRTLRNACGHNNCILFNLNQNTERAKPGYEVTKFVSEIPGIGVKERNKKLTSRPIFEICCLMIAEEKYVTAEVRRHQMNTLHSFVHGRLQKYPEAYSESRTIISTIDFLVKIVDKYYI